MCVYVCVWGTYIPQTPTPSKNDYQVPIFQNEYSVIVVIRLINREGAKNESD